MTVPSKVLDAYRDVFISHGWWDDTYSQFCEEMREHGIGIEESKIYFSGFSSQGDGACFECMIAHEPQFFERNPEFGSKFPSIKQAIDDDLLCAVSIKCDPKGIYNHEYTMRVGEWFIDQYNTEVTEPLALLSRKHTNEGIRQESEPFMDAFLEWCRDKARMLYRRLEAEYAMLTSDEMVRTFIVANKLWEDEDEQAVSCSLDTAWRNCGSRSVPADGRRTEKAA